MNDLILKIEEIKQAATELFESEYLEVESGVMLEVLVALFKMRSYNLFV